MAGSLVGPGTGAFRDFSYIATEIPEFIEENCAMESRAFPIFIYDPTAGPRIKDRLSLRGTAVNDGWYTIRKTGETIDFIHFARTEGRFAKQFDEDGTPSETLLAAQEDRLENWNMLQEMAGII